MLLRLVEEAGLSCSKITGWMERGGLSFFAPPLFLRCRPLRSLPLRSDSLISGQQQELNSARRRTPPPRLPRAGHSCMPRKKKKSPPPWCHHSRPGAEPFQGRWKKNQQNEFERLQAEITESSDQAHWPSLSHYFNSPAKSSRAASEKLSEFQHAGTVTLLSRRGNFQGCLFLVPTSSYFWCFFESLTQLYKLTWFLKYS